MFLTQQEEYDQYRETSEKKIKAYTEENTKLANELNELKDKNSNMEMEIIRLKETAERLENERLENEELLKKKKKTKIEKLMIILVKYRHCKANY